MPSQCELRIEYFFYFYRFWPLVPGAHLFGMPQSIPVTPDPTPFPATAVTPHHRLQQPTRPRQPIRMLSIRTSTPASGAGMNRAGKPCTSMRYGRTTTGLPLYGTNPAKSSLHHRPLSCRMVLHGETRRRKHLPVHRYPYREYRNRGSTCSFSTAVCCEFRWEDVQLFICTQV